MKLSVIVSTYNSPATLEKAIGGLAAQSAAPHEVIVADDGSGPETAALANDLKSKVPFTLSHVWHEDEGFRLAKIRNEAVKAATGDYLVFLDGDCIAARHYVEDHATLAERGFFVQGKRVLLDHDVSLRTGPAEAHSARFMAGAMLTGHVANAHHLLRMPFLPARHTTKLSGIKGCSIGVFRDDVLAVNGFNEEFVGWGREDQEFAARLYKLGLKRKEHPFMAICFHLWHPESSGRGLSENDERLRRTIEGDGCRAPRGISKQ